MWSNISKWGAITVISASGFFLSGLSSETSNVPSSSFSLTRSENLATSRVPRLIRAESSTHTAGATSTYYFTIFVPQEAQDSLKAVVITQKSGLEEIAFESQKSQAFLGGDLGSGSVVPLVAMGGTQPQDKNEVTVVFEEAIPPGNTVTIALEVRQNPIYGGIYQLGVVAFPDSENSPPLDLGTARLQFMGSN